MEFKDQSCWETLYRVHQCVQPKLPTPTVGGKISLVGFYFPNRGLTLDLFSPKAEMAACSTHTTTFLSTFWEERKEWLVHIETE